MEFHEYPDWANFIINRYWFLRYCRVFQTARKRKEYRLIEREKKRLAELGVDVELMRLLCRHLVNLKNKNAEKRWWSKYYESLPKLPES